MVQPAALFPGVILLLSTPVVDNEGKESRLSMEIVVFYELIIEQHFRPPI